MMDFHGSQCKLFLIYVVMGLRVAIFKFLYINTLFMAKTDFFFAIMYSIVLNF